MAERIAENVIVSSMFGIPVGGLVGCFNHQLGVMLMVASLAVEVIACGVSDYEQEKRFSALRGK